MLLLWVCRVALEHKTKRVKLTREQYEPNKKLFWTSQNTSACWRSACMLMTLNGEKSQNFKKKNT